MLELLRAARAVSVAGLRRSNRVVVRMRMRVVAYPLLVVLTQRRTAIAPLRHPRIITRCPAAGLPVTVSVARSRIGTRWPRVAVPPPAVNASLSRRFAGAGSAVGVGSGEALNRGAGVAVAVAVAVDVGDAGGEALGVGLGGGVIVAVGAGAGAGAGAGVGVELRVAVALAVGLGVGDGVGVGAWTAPQVEKEHSSWWGSASP
jgi:hypothetical protein